MSYEYIEETGIVIADTETIQEEVKQEYLDTYGSDLDTQDGTIASVMISVETDRRTTIAQQMALLANLTNPNLSSGIFLDALWALTSGERSVSTSTEVVATCTGVSSTVLPAGSVAETSEGDRFITLSDFTISSSGSVDVTFYSEETGAIPCQAGALTIISDGGVLGWETVNNDSAGVLGQSTQSDASARADRKLTLAAGAKGTDDSIISGLYAIDTVSSLKFQKNDKSTTEIIDNVSMVPHSIYICIDGGTDDEIAVALDNYKAPGVAYNFGSGINTTVTITSESSGQPLTVEFDRPNEINIKIQISIKVTSSNANIITTVKDLILEYTNSDIRDEGFKVGIDVSPFEISQFVSSNTDYYVQDCQVTKQSVDVFQRQTIDIETYEKAVTSSSLIEVIIV